jgi:hypothetical protein
MCKATFLMSSLFSSSDSTFRTQTHRDLPQEWYRTPVDFIDGPRFQIDTHWCYYTRLTHLLRMPIISRPMRCKPWDRFPSDIWIPAEKSWLLGPFGGFVLLVFSGWFLLGWNFFFPTPIELWMWRVCAVVQAVFGVYGGLYYLIEGFKWHAAYEKMQRAIATPPPTATLTNTAADATKVTSTESTLFILPSNVDAEAQSPPETTAGPESSFRRRWNRCLPRRLAVRLDYLIRRYRKLDAWCDRIRNISPDQDPEMALPLYVIVPVTTICALYTMCRAYFYIEDYLSLRVQPAGVYVTVNRYVPFWGDG